MRRKAWRVGLLVLVVLMFSAGCGQKAAEPPKDELAGKAAVEQLAWPEREAYDKAFDASRNATMMLGAQDCSCGAEGISCLQSYTDASVGASAVRDCPSGAGKDNLVTEEYADSFYCPACCKQEVTLTTEEIWLGRSQMNMPHYHLGETDKASWCCIYTDTQGDKWAYIYDEPNWLEPSERIQLERDESAIERIGAVFAAKLPEA